MNKEANYLKKNKDTFIKELFEFLKIPSVSAQSKYNNEIKKAALFVKKKILQAGIDNTKIIETNGHPLVFAEKILNESFPTLLIYGHYDVQPPEPIELWETPPFDPNIRNNRIYCRGAADDKGQIYIHIKAIETLIATKNLNFNIKFIIEGEEEMGSENLSLFLNKRENLDLLQTDCVLVSDTEMISLDSPSIPTSLRGIVTMDIEVLGANRDLHSGVYGGAVANPIEILSNMITSLKDDNSHILIKNFYDDVIKLTTKERENLNKNPFDLSNYKKELDINDIYGEKGYTTIERTGIRPSLEINGIWGGYTEKEGFKTVLPSKAFAKLSIRLVANQNASQIAKNCKEFLLKKAPVGVRVKIKIHDGMSNGMIVDINSKAFKSAFNAIKKVFNKEPILTRGGGSIPILTKFKEKLEAPIVMLGFGLPSDNIHSPNENFGIDNFFLGLDTILEFYKDFGSK